MTRFLLPATAGIAFLTATTAYSATCSASADYLFATDDTSGLDVNEDGVSVVIASGVTLSGAGHAIKLNDASPARVENCGALTGLGKDGINADGANLTVINHGTITGADEGIQGAAGLSVTNTGTITAEDKGIDADDQDGVTVRNSGTINAVDKAIRVGGGADALLVNSGVVLSQTDEGFEAGDNAVVRNRVGGVIQAWDDAVQVGDNGLIVNRGTIENIQNAADQSGPDPDPQDAIDIDSGRIVNHATGLIKSTYDAAIDFDESDAGLGGVIVNRGMITGTVGVQTDDANTGGQKIVNHGTLIGTSGLAANLGQGRDVMALHAGSTLSGGVNFGTGNDKLSIFDGLMGLVGGVDAILDGGADFDTVVFRGLGVADVTGVSFIDNVLSLQFDGFGLTLTNWERYRFGKDRYTTDELVAAVAPVPLPAGAALMIPALGLLGWAARRRRG